jgi:CheY-like chemotaxis protein
VAEVIRDDGPHASTRLLDRTGMHLHRDETRLDPERRRALEELRRTDPVLLGKRVLIVDDDVRNVFALTTMLEARGMIVTHAENGREAIDRLAREPVDIVLMDLMMPVMDGYRATRTIRQIPGLAILPVICLTAKALKGDREACLAAGATDYVAKPVDIGHLLSLLRVWLTR